jgi:hypothetical protein
MNKINLKKSNNIQSSDLVYRHNHSADLVKKISNYKLENNKTISQNLTINGISFFDIFTAELAHYHFPQVFLKKKLNYFFLKKIKHDIKLFFFKKNNLIDTKTQRNKDFNLPQRGVFLLGFTNRMYVDILHPLALELNKNKNNSLVFLFEKTREYLKDLKISNAVYYNLNYCNNNKIRKDSINLIIELNKAINDINIDQCLNNILTEDDLEYLIFFKNLLKRFFYIYIPSIVKDVVIAQYMLEKYKPKILISPDTADSKARIFAILAKNYNIPYLEIQFGLAGEEAVEWKFSLANLIAVWGQSSQHAISKQLGNDQNIVVTGSPRHDFIKNYNSNNLFKNLTVNKKVILLASTYHFKESNHVDVSILRSMQLAISDAAKNNSNIFLIIKPHPHENEQETKLLFKDINNSLFLDKNSDIRSAILHCDAFISYGSTSTIDAMIANKLIICPVFDGWDFSSDFFKNSDATLNPTNEKEISEIFNNINNETYLELYKDIFTKNKKFLDKVVYKSDGNGSKRIIHAINNKFNLNI